MEASWILCIVCKVYQLKVSSPQISANTGIQTADNDEVRLQTEESNRLETLIASERAEMERLRAENSAFSQTSSDVSGSFSLLYLIRGLTMMCTDSRRFVPSMSSVADPIWLLHSIQLEVVTGQP